MSIIANEKRHGVSIAACVSCQKQKCSASGTWRMGVSSKVVSKCKGHTTLLPVRSSLTKCVMFQGLSYLAE